jgi:drug/metabolite transporter (DMT)-like permease
MNDQRLQEPREGRSSRPWLRPGFASLHTAVFLFGMSGLLGKWLTVSPLVIVFARAALAAVFLGLLLRFQGKRWEPLCQREWRWLGFAGLILAAHWVTFFQAIQVSTVALGLLAFSSYPAFVALLEPWCFRERYRQTDLLLAGVVVGGLLLVVPAYEWRGRAGQGVLWGIVSGFTFAVLTLLNRRQARETSPMVVAGVQNAVAALVLLPAALWLRPRLTPSTLLALGVLGVLCTGLAHWLFVRSLRLVRAQTAAITTGLEPVYGILFAWVLLGEVPAGRTLLGGTIILAASVGAAWLAPRVPSAAGSPTGSAEAPNRTA